LRLFMPGQQETNKHKKRDEPYPVTGGMDMKKKRRMDRQVQKIIGIVCLSFLLGALGGAVAANLLPAGEQGELTLFLQGAAEETEMPSFPCTSNGRIGPSGPTLTSTPAGWKTLWANSPPRRWRTRTRTLTMR